MPQPNRGTREPRAAKRKREEDLSPQEKAERSAPWEPTMRSVLRRLLNRNITQIEFWKEEDLLKEVEAALIKSGLNKESGVGKFRAFIENIREKSLREMTGEQFQMLLAFLDPNHRNMHAPQLITESVHEIPATFGD